MPFCFRNSRTGIVKRKILFLIHCCQQQQQIKNKTVWGREGEIVASLLFLLSFFLMLYFCSKSPAFPFFPHLSFDLITVLSALFLFSHYHLFVFLFPFPSFPLSLYQLASHPTIIIHSSCNPLSNPSPTLSHTESLQSNVFTVEI